MPTDHSASPPGPPAVLCVGVDAALLERLDGQTLALTAVPDIAAALAILRSARMDVLVLGRAPSAAEAEQIVEAVRRHSPGARTLALELPAERGLLEALINQSALHGIVGAPLTSARLQLAIEQQAQARRTLLRGQSQAEEALGELERLRLLTLDLEEQLRQRSEDLAQAQSKLGTTEKESDYRRRALSLLNESMALQSTLDPLTGLVNRREFRQRLTAEWGRFRRHQRPLSIVLLDVDQFKAINDQHGRECGDSVLQNLGGLLRNQLRRHDVACRYGGEVFALLLPETRLDNGFRVAEQVRQRVAANDFTHKGIPLRVTISAGVAGAEEQAPASEEEFVRFADLALNRAKADGRNRTIVVETRDPTQIRLSSSAGNTPA